MNNVLPVVKTVVCLANSRKYGGRCIAGKVIDDGLPPIWFRPVSTHPDGALSVCDVRFEDGRCPQLLDVLEIPVKRPSTHDFQKENWLISDDYYWDSEARFEGNLSNLCDDVDTLWFNTSRHPHSCNDSVSESDLPAVHSSLLLIEPEMMRIRVVQFGGKKSVRARFCYRDVWYDLKVTDPVVEAHYKERPVCVEIIKTRPLYLCISLGLPFRGHAYKLVASIIGLC